MERRIILVAHGKVAFEMKNSMEMIAGKHSEVSYVNLDPSIGAVDLREKLLQKIENGFKTLVICDIIGGTPCNEAFKIALEKENITVISGLSLGMVLQAILSTEKNYEKWITEVMDAGRNMIKDIVQIFGTEEED